MLRCDDTSQSLHHYIIVLSPSPLSSPVSTPIHDQQQLVPSSPSSPSAGIQTQRCGSRNIRFVNIMDLNCYPRTISDSGSRHRTPPIEALFVTTMDLHYFYLCSLRLPVHHSSRVSGITYSLSTSTSLLFPQAVLSNPDTQSFITSNLGLSKSRTQNGASNLTAPGTSSCSNTFGRALQVQHPAGSYENDDDGGAQLYALWNSNGGAFQSMLLS